MAIVIALGVCVLFVAIGELARRGAARVLGVPVTPLARVFADFRSGSRARRVVTLLAGSLATLIAVVALAFLVFRFDGIRTGIHRYSVARVVPDMPAVGKLESGDHLLAVNGTPLEHGSLWALIEASRGAPVRITYKRAGAQHEVTLEPIQREGRWVIGIHPRIHYVKIYDSALATRYAVRFPFQRIGRHLSLLAEQETAEPGGPKRIFDEVSVPVPFWSGVARVALEFSVYILALVVLLDLIRAALVIARRETRV